MPAALLLSVLIHLLGISGAADWMLQQFHRDEPQDGPPLRAVLKPPPPPVFEVPRPVPPPKVKPRPRTPAIPAITAPQSPAPEIAAIPELADAGPAAVTQLPAPPAAEPLPSPPDPVLAPPAPLPIIEAAVPEPRPEPPRIPVPKRIELVGTLFVGDQNFMVGTGGFRLRHDGNRYEISVLGQPKGLARLFLSGEFTGVSRGAITPGGLQPSEYVEERGRIDRRESVTLDWEAGVIRLRNDKVVPIEPPVFDRLSVLMQFYYRPPESNELSVRVAGTRNVDTYTFRREGDEKIELAWGRIDTHRWRVNFDNGDPRIEIWMSPEYHYLPLRVRIHGRKENGGRVATLNIDEIRVED